MYYSMAEMSVGRIVRGRNVRGRNVLAETSVAEMSVAEMSEHRLFYPFLRILKKNYKHMVELVETDQHSDNFFFSQDFVMHFKFSLAWQILVQKI